MIKIPLKSPKMKKINKNKNKIPKPYIGVFQDYFGHIVAFGVILVILGICSVFWS
jgi:hypothetical protein